MQLFKIGFLYISLLKVRIHIWYNDTLPEGISTNWEGFTMIYRNFKGKQISMLGFGAMRLPTVGGNDSDIDEPQVQRMVDYAIEKGVNYFDTAWGYHEGQSEIVMGRCLSKHPRDSYYLATKFPGYDLSNMPKVREIFAKQQEKTKKDYFDFYLMHNVCELNINEYLNPKYGIVKYLTQMRDEGKIRHLGFSCHGNMDVLKRFMDAYGEDMEFCQLQVNYLDWTFQDAKEKCEYLEKNNIPLWVMEPLRGGRLANLPDELSAPLKASRPNETVPGWAFRFLQTIPNTTVILSGSSDEEQITQNIKTFETDDPLNDEEMRILEDISAALTDTRQVPCTACRYCTTHCPQSLDIPRLLGLYNEHMFTASAGGMAFIAPMTIGGFPEEKRPSACIHCHSCEEVCPQMIKISSIMEDFTKVLAL